MIVRCVGFDPGISHFASVVVSDVGSGLPGVLERETRKLALTELVERAHDVTIARIGPHVVSRDAEQDTWDLIVGVETFEHRSYVVRRIASAPRMGAVYAAIVLGARALGVPVYPIEPTEHRNMIPRGQYPKQLRNIHERDAYTVALQAIAQHRLGTRARTGPGASNINSVSRDVEQGE